MADATHSILYHENAGKHFPVGSEGHHAAEQHYKHLAALSGFHSVEHARLVLKRGDKDQKEAAAEWLIDHPKARTKPDTALLNEYIYENHHHSIMSPNPYGRHDALDARMLTPHETRISGYVRRYLGNLDAKSAKGKSTSNEDKVENVAELRKWADKAGKWKVAETAMGNDIQLPTRGMAFTESFGSTAKSHKDNMGIEWEGPLGQHSVMTHDKMDKRVMWYDFVHEHVELPEDFWLDQRRRTPEEERQLHKRLRESPESNTGPWELELTDPEKSQLVAKMEAWCSSTKRHAPHYGGLNMSRGHNTQAPGPRSIQGSASR